MNNFYWDLHRLLRSDDESILYIGFLFISILMILLSYWIIFKFVRELPYINENDIKYFKKILKYKIVLAIPFAFVSLPGLLEPIILAPFSLAAAILPLLVFLRVLTKKSAVKNDIFLAKNQEGINLAVSEILDSKSFLTALRSTLPRGDKDEEHGLDYIPYMLKNIDDRRDRFHSRSQFFLIATVFVGLIFSGITIWLGYIILNEDSIGTGRTLRNIEDSTMEIKKYLPLLNSNTISEYDGFSKISAKIKIYSEILPSQDDTIDKKELKEIFNRFYKSKDLKEINGRLDQYLNPYYNSSDGIIYPERVFSSNDYINQLDILKFEIRDILSFQETARKKIPVAIANLENFTKAAQNDLKKDSARTPELIKRLVLGFVVISFFLAILKFLANQYRLNFEHLIKVDQEDMYIRKTYIALKISDIDNESKKLVLTQLLMKPDSSEGNNKSDIQDSLPIIKDLIESLSKKL